MPAPRYILSALVVCAAVASPALAAKTTYTYKGKTDEKDPISFKASDKKLTGLVTPWTASCVSHKTINGTTTIKSLKLVHKHDSSGKYLWFEKKGRYNGGFSYNGQDYTAKYSFDIFASIQKHVADGGVYGYVEVFDSTGTRVDECATGGEFDQNGWFTLGGGNPFKVKGR